MINIEGPETAPIKYGEHVPTRVGRNVAPLNQHT